MKQNGYVQKQFGIKTKRFCQTLDLKNEPELIAAYKKLHEEGHVWREILNGIKEVGILEMEIVSHNRADILHQISAPSFIFACLSTVYSCGRGCGLLPDYCMVSKALRP